MKFVKAILLLESSQPFSKTTGDTPAVLVDVLGKNTLARTVENLNRLGFGEVIVIAEKSLAESRAVRESAAGATVVPAADAQLWRMAEQTFEAAAEDSTHVLIIRLNAYAELNFDELLEHHRSHLNKVTRVFSGAGDAAKPLDIFLVNSSRRNDAAFLLRSEMDNARTGTPYLAGPEEYVNFLQHEADLRQLASDSLHHISKMQPAGTEVRPGIWIAADAQIDKRARLVAPIFVGSRARICPGAVVTRGS